MRERKRFLGLLDENKKLNIEVAELTESIKDYKSIVGSVNEAKELLERER